MSKKETYNTQSSKTSGSPINIFKFNSKLTYLAVYLIAIGNGLLLIKKWDSLTEFEIFLCTGLVTAGIIGLIKLIFFKSNYKKLIPEKIKA